MKKIFSILFASVIALMAVSCYQEDLAVFEISKAKAPVLGSYEVGDKAITASFTPGSFNQTFNQKVAPNHFFVITKVDGKSVSKAVTTSNKDGVLSASITSINNTLISMGYVEGDVVSIVMHIRASMQTNAGDNGRNGYVDSEGTIELPGFEIVFPTGSPYMEYTLTSPFGVIGSLPNYEMSWDKDLEMWMTEDGMRHVAKYVHLNAGDEFKFRKDQSWTENYGGDFGSLGNPFEVSQDGPNIKAPADGYYDLWLDLSTGTATLTDAFVAYPGCVEASNWTVIGSLSEYGISWDGDIDMLTDGNIHVAQGVKLAAADEFKFRQDKAWTVNLGGDFGGLGSDFAVSQDGPNIKVGGDGIFDLVVNPGAMTAQIVETLGGGVSGIIGGDEPGPEPTPVTGWNIIGLNGDWENDVLATQDGSKWTAYVTANESTDFKWRKDGGWDENYGGVMVALGEPFEAVAGGDNVKVDAGFWKVVLDTEALTITVSVGDVWSLIGVNGDWDHDIDMVLTDGKWVSPFTAIGGEFKLRYNHAWDDNRGGDMVALGQEFPAVAGGNNINVEQGNYIVTYDPTAETIKVEKAVRGWNIIGLNGNWNDDILATENNGIWTVRVTAETDTEFKWRKDGGWDENYGGDFVELGVPFPAVAGGNNVKLAAGYWLLTLDFTGAEPVLMVSDGTVWSLIGVNGDWDNDIEMSLVDGVWVSPETAISGDFKIRKNHGWDDNRGGVMVALGEPFDAVAGGDNIKVDEGTYVVTYDPAAEKITVSNAKKVWSLIGVNGDWNTDIDMEEVMPGIWMSPKVEIASPEWKIRFDHSWDVNRGGDTPTAVGQFVAAVPNGANINLTGTFKVVYNANNGTIGTLGWGVIGTINGWNGDVPMNLASDGKWYSVPVTLAETDEIKIRWDADWGVNRGGDFVAVGEPFAVENNGANIKGVPAGTYMLVYDPAAEQITVTKAYWGMVGAFNGWGNDPDIFLMFDGAKWCAYGQTAAGDWKLRQGSTWDVNRGGTFAAAGEPFAVENNGANINLGDMTNYSVVYDPTAETITVQ